MKRYVLLLILALCSRSLVAQKPRAQINASRENPVEMQGLFKAMVTDFGGSRGFICPGADACPTAPFVSIYADQVAESRDDTVKVSFVYGISDLAATQSVQGVGAILPTNGLVQLSSGTTSPGLAQLESKERVHYVPGHESYAFFAAAYTDSLESGQQWVGLYDDVDGAAIGVLNGEFSILYRRNSIDTVVNRADFNIDPLDRTGPSAFILTQTNLNVFRISFGALGASPIKFQILEQNGNWITFHQIINSNSTTNTNFINPDLPIRAESINDAGNDDLILISGNWCGGSIGLPSLSGARPFVATAGLTPFGPGETHVLTVRNKSTYQSVNNRLKVRVAGIHAYTAGVAEDYVTLLTRFNLRKNATISSPSFADVDTDNSIMELSTAGSYTPSTGINLFSTVVAENSVRGPTLSTAFAGAASTIQLDKDILLIELSPGESLTLTAEDILYTTSVGGGIVWEELFY